HDTVSGRSYPAQRYCLAVADGFSISQQRRIHGRGWPAGLGRPSVFRDENREPTWTYSRRVGTALPANRDPLQPCRARRIEGEEVGTRYKPTPLSHQGLPSGFNAATLALRSWLDSRCIASVIWRKVRAPQGRVPGNAWGV